MVDQRIAELEAEIARLRAGVFEPSSYPLVRAPDSVQPLFEQATVALRDYFRGVAIDPARAMIALGDERYLLVRASAFSIDFLDSLVRLYADRGDREALAIGRGFLFDIAHTLGFSDANALSKRLGSDSPVQRLSWGPVHFAFTGWSLVDIAPSSNPVPSDDYCLVYSHPYSFEAAAWLRAGRTSSGPVCIMNAGYSSGWCKASFGLELTAIEVTCKARGDESCNFVMAPPHRIAERVREHFGVDVEQLAEKGFDVPAYFERKRVEEELRNSLARLKEAQDELIRKERLATIGLLVAAVAHEVNTPLGVAVTAMSFLGDELDALNAKFEGQSLTRADIRAFFERAGRARSMVSDNLSRAAAQVVSFRSVAGDQMTEERRKIDVAEYVRTTLDNLAPIVRKNALDVSLTHEGELEVLTHPGALAQILTNLVTNSARHGRAPDAATTPLAIKIDLRRRDPSTIVLSYSDDGRGMTEEVRSKIFQPFFTTARREGGMGLGLHIIRSLVADVLKGRIDLETDPGRGVRFEIEIPVQ